MLPSEDFLIIWKSLREKGFHIHPEYTFLKKLLWVAGLIYFSGFWCQVPQNTSCYFSKTYYF